MVEVRVPDPARNDLGQRQGTNQDDARPVPGPLMARPRRV